MSLNQKKWMIAPYNSQLQLEISESLNISPVLAQLCITRGIYQMEEAEKFIDINSNEFHDPFSFLQMQQAVNLIEKAIKDQEKILIYGDYDVDGITATSLIYLYLKTKTSLVHYYIPARLDEGYGLNEEAIHWADQEGYRLIITVDCGISSITEAELAKSLGIKLIITDHHTPPKDLPDAAAIINPKIKDSGYPFLDLAGVGVAWKLAQGIEISSGLLKNDFNTVLAEYLDLVALGTVADVVSLKGENRVIVSLGLKKIAESKRPGIKALLFTTGLENKPITSVSVGFILAPRINAVGRLAKGGLAVQLLTGSKEEECLALAKELEELNHRRQEIEREILDEAVRMIEEKIDLTADFVIVLASEKWHPGVIGIVASRLVEKYYRPVVLLAIEGNIAKGSARSIEDFDIYQAFDHCHELLIQFGGHKVAAGLKLKQQNILPFQKAINNYWGESINRDLPLPTVKIDLELDINGAEWEYIEDSEILAPFGAGNPQPVFACFNLMIAEAKAVGNLQNHLKIKFDAGEYFLDGIGFNLAHHLSWLEPFARVDAAVALEKNIWNGLEKVQLVIKDIRPHQSDEEIVPSSNKNMPQLIKKIAVPKLLADYREVEHKEKYLLNLLANKEACLIYVSSPEEIEKLVQLIAKKEAAIKLGSCYEDQKPWQHGLIIEKIKNKTLNGLVFTGKLTADPEGIFQHLIFFHSPPNLEEFCRCISISSTQQIPKIHLLFNREDLKSLENDLKTIFPDRELLGKIYKAVKSLASSSNQLLGSKAEIMQKIRIEGLDKGKEKAFEAWIAIMMELGLIKMSLMGNRYRLELVNSGNKCNLEDSYLYVFGLEEKKAFEHWQRIAFSPRLDEEICALLS